MGKGRGGLGGAGLGSGHSVSTSGSTYELTTGSDTHHSDS